MSNPNKTSQTAIYKDLWLKELMAYQPQSRILQNWEVVSYLDQGTFARIFKIAHRETGSPAVLKFIPNPMELNQCSAPNSPEDRFFLTRFAASKREAEIMTRFQGDKHIIQYLEEPEYLERTFQNDEGQTVCQHAVLICMPLYKNHKEWLPLVLDSQAGRLHLGMEMAQALMSFEEKGVFHRDIKPGNILMDNDYHFYLSDVGEAKLESEFTTMGFHGTRPYMAPEVYEQENKQQKMRSDHRSDLYSLGIILYKLYNRNQFPFLTHEGELTEEATVSYRSYQQKNNVEDDEFLTPSERARMLRYNGFELPPPCDAGAQLSQVILRACAYKREDRYQKAADLFAALQCCAKGEPLPQALQYKTGKASKKAAGFKRYVPIACAVLAVALAFGLGKYDGQQSKTDREDVVSVTPTPQPTQSPAELFAGKPRNTISVDDYELNLYDNNLAQITKYTGADTEVVIPAELIGYRVAGIGNQAFFNCASLTSITIPDSVTTIGNAAFESCSALTSITIPDSVTTIGNNPFANCTQLSNIIVSADHPVFETVDGVLFNKAEKKLISYPKALSYTEYLIPQGTKAIGDWAFWNCDTLTNVTIPDSVASIGDRSFAYCDSLTSIIVPDNITSSKNNAFFTCPKLILTVTPGSNAEKIAVKNGVPYQAGKPLNTITAGAYELNVYENNLAQITKYTGTDTELIIPAMLHGYQVVGIADFSFYKCTSLASVTVPDGVTTIGESAFELCSALASVTLPNSVISIEAYAFSNCEALTSFNIPEGVVSLGNSVFSSCTALTSIAIPDNVTIIGDNPFVYCQQLSSIVVSANHPVLETVNGVLFNKTEKKLIHYPATLTQTSYAIPQGTTTIGYNSFNYCSTLANITIPNSVTTIESVAFEHCSSLVSLTIPDSVTTIGNNPFANCTQLSNIIVSANHPVFETIAGALFNKAEKKLICYPEALVRTDYAIPQDTKAIGDWAFWNCDNLTSVTIPDGITTIGNRVFSYCDSLTSITVPQSVTSINDRAFFNCPKITLTVTPGSYAEKFAVEKAIQYQAGKPLSTITAGAYELHVYENNLASITKYTGTDTELIIPATIQGYHVVEIADFSFYKCTSLASVTVPDGVTTIGESAFELCSALASVTLPNSVISIEAYAFSNCEALTSFNIPEGVVSLGNFVFSSCTALTSIAIPDNVTIIGDNPFGYCQQLSSIVVSANHPVLETVNGVLFNKTEKKLIHYPATLTQTSYAIPQGTTTIGYNSFNYCSTLTNITIPNSVTTIESAAFEQCSSLVSLTIPDSVTTIENNPFASCSKLSTIIVSANHPVFETIDGALFNKAEKKLICYPEALARTDYTIPQGTKTIGDWAFWNCDNLTSVTIPDSVTTIGNRVFSYCDSLTSITIPQSVTSINDRAFFNCPKLTLTVTPGSYAEKFAINNSIQHQTGNAASSVANVEKILAKGSTGTVTLNNYRLDVYANDLAVITGYSGNDVVLNIPSKIDKYQIVGIGNNAFEFCDSLTDITIPDGVIFIGNDAFQLCFSLSSIYIPDSVTTIESNPFTGCIELININVSKNHPVLEMKDGVLFNKAEKKLVCYPCVLENRDYEIPSDTKVIGDYAFWSNDSLKTITIPNSVTSIGNYTFAFCYSLKDINIPSSVTSIGYCAFLDCISLTNITIPSSVTSIGYSTFSGCTSLSSITIPDSVTSIGYGTFSGCTSLSSITIPDSVTSIGSSAFEDCPKLTIITPSGSDAATYAKENGIPCKNK